MEDKMVVNKMFLYLVIEKESLKMKEGICCEKLSSFHKSCFYA
jgi:hypothetical protein